MQHRSERSFAHQKLLLLIIIIFRFEIVDEIVKYRKLFEEDLQLCPQCFYHQKNTCNKLLENIVSSDELQLQNVLSSLLPISVTRQTNVFRVKNSTARIMAKYLLKDKQQLLLPLLMGNQLNSERLHQIYRSRTVEHLDGMQFCPHTRMQRFVELFSAGESVIGSHDLTTWLYLVVNVQPLLMPALSAREFAVPQHYAACGFGLYQRYAGVPLYRFYGSRNFTLKLHIAKQLLEAVLQFSEGFEGFRFYVIDLNADNIVYDEREQRLSFVDLDSVYIVDSRALALTQLSATTHKHTHIECHNCFAYSPQDICAHSRSDVIVFVACQLLRENLNGERSGGFLQPIPHQYAELIAQLDVCVDCASVTCENRFVAAHVLIASIAKLLV